MLEPTVYPTRTRPNGMCEAIKLTLPRIHPPLPRNVLQNPQGVESGPSPRNVQILHPCLCSKYPPRRLQKIPPTMPKMVFCGASRVASVQTNLLAQMRTAIVKSPPGTHLCNRNCLHRCDHRGFLGVGLLARPYTLRPPGAHLCRQICLHKCAPKGAML